IGPVNVNFEHKKVATGRHGKGLGFNCGEQGTLMFYDQRPMMQVRLFRETLAKLQPILEAIDFRGQIDVNCIVNEKGIFPLELTPRLGYPSSYIEPELQITPWSELFYAIASGRSINNKVKAGWGVGVVLCGEGYPFWDEGYERSAGLPFFGLNAETIEHFHPYDLQVKNDKILLTGSYVGAVTAQGRSLE